MSINRSKLIELRDLASLHFRRKHIIVLDPKEKNEGPEDLNKNIIYDKAEWNISGEIQTFINELSQNGELSNEDKILSIFERLCQDYIYDDNLISYIQKIDDESFDVPDWYGREVDQQWEKNREQHRRRVCYELSRYLAKSLKELFKDEEDVEVCIFWDKNLTHYFVGLTCNQYSVTLDLDDFKNIKDLTRIKAGLTPQGIVILEDNNSIFQSAIDKFNESRSEDSIIKIENDIDINLLPDTDIQNENYSQIDNPEDIVFLRNALSILREKYGIDSQGAFEYLKEIVDIKLGPESRKKIWKKLEGQGDKQTRYIRCLCVYVDDQEYLIDVDGTLVRAFSTEELEGENPEFIEYKKLSRDEDEQYNGL